MSEIPPIIVNISKMNEELASKLVGKLATLADAAIASDRQVKFFKDSLKDIVWGIEKERAERTGMKELYLRWESLPGK